MVATTKSGTPKRHLNLQDVFDSYVEMRPVEEHSFLRKYGMVLIISLSKGRKGDPTSTGADTLGFRNGYASKSAKAHNAHLSPFLVCEKAWALKPDENGKMSLYEFDDLGRSFTDPELKAEHEGMKINWKFNLYENFLKEIMKVDPTERVRDIWGNFKTYVKENQSLQLQMLVVKDVDKEKGAVEIINVPRKNQINPEKAGLIFLKSTDIISSKLVLSGELGYFPKVDTASCPMTGLEGKKHLTDGSDDSVRETVTVEDSFKKVKKKKKKQQEQQQQLNQVEIAAVDSSAAASQPVVVTSDNDPFEV